jgi:predicted methyltransferase
MPRPRFGPGRIGSKTIVEDNVTRRLATLSIALALSASAASLVATGVMAAAPGHVAAAVADANRPQADKDLDATRKPTELLVFTGLKPGDKVVDLMPGRGYTTRLFSKTVGAKGKVYALAPPMFAERMKGVAGDPNFSNISFLAQELTAISPPEKVDLVWTSQNYHDLASPPREGRPAMDILAFNKAVFNALKPGGIYVITDHRAAAGTPAAEIPKLHRIDPALVKAQVQAAGFVLAGESEALANPKDDPKAMSEAPGPRNTDKFVLKFRKPA